MDTVYAKNVRKGLQLDPACDAYADPKKDNVVLMFDYATVTDVQQETLSCVRVDTTNGSFGFTPNHRLKETGVQ